MILLKKFCETSVALLAFAACAASAQSTAEAVPPRTITDVTALLGQYKPDAAAIAAARATLAKNPPLGASEGQLAQFYLERLGAAARLGDQVEKLKAARSAGKLTIFDRRLVQRLLNEWANAEEGAGHLLEGIRLRELSRSQYSFASGNRISDNAWLADTYASLGDLGAGKRLLADSETMYRQLLASDLWQESLTALIERQRGDVFARDGKYADAEAAYRKAFVAVDKDVEINRQRISARMDTPSQEIIVYMRNLRARKLAGALLELGSVAEAEYYARDALRNSLEWSGRSHPGTADALAMLADVMLAQGRFRDAEALARARLASLAEAGIGGTSISLARARGQIAATLVAQERWQEALEEYERRQQGVGDDPELNRFLERATRDLGIALFQTGQFQRAAEIFAKQHRWWMDNYGASNLFSATMLAFGALSRAGLGQTDAALAELAVALPVLIERGRDGASEDRGGFVSALRFKWISEGYLRLLARKAQGAAGPSSEEAVAEAFRIADLARGSAVQRSLAASAARANIRDPQLAELVRREQDAGQRIGSLSSILSSVLSRPAAQQLPKVVADMRGDIDALGAERIALLKQIEQRFPEYSNLINPRPVTLAQARASLQPGEAMVSIYVATEQTYVWAFGKEGFAAFTVVAQGAKQIAERVARLRKALDAGEVSLANFPRFDLDLAHELYQLLLKPVAPGTASATRVFVVPHGALGQLPFALLTTAPHALAPETALFEGYRKVPWLIRQASVSQLPSVSTLVTLRSLPAPAAGRRAFAGFGDPRFSATVAAAGSGGMRGFRLRSLAVGTVDAQGSQVASNQLRNLSPLPDTADEIRDIAALLKADAAKDVYLDLRAAETNVKLADLARTRVLVFATHGLVPGDLNGLTEPALALSNPELTGEKDSDGLLGMSEILSLKLDADWVVLSACNTAAADGAAAEAVSGLGRAFFYAGARALLVSNWPVETVSARLLTTGIFRRQAADSKLARAEALQLTMLELIDSAYARDANGKVLYSYAHPMFWAPFTLVGDGGR